MRPVTRRQLLQKFGAAAAVAPLAVVFGERAFAQGRCMLTPGTPACNTTAIKPLFEPTGWKTIGLDHITFGVADYQKEAAFYAALMGWTPRTDDGKQAVMDLGTWGSVIFRQSAMDAAPAGAGGGRGSASRAVVESFCFVIDKWNAKTVEAELRKRGLTPVADNDGKGFESFHVKDPDGFDLQISNSGGLVKDRKSTSNAKLAAPAPFESTGWKTVWLDHLSFSVSNYKESVSFYTSLLGWTPTYDEGSQNELLIGDVGNVIVRGGNPLDPNFGRGGRGGAAAAAAPGAGAAPAVRSARIDTSSRHQTSDGAWVPDEIHTAAFKSYHTQTPNGYNLQISYVTHDNRLALSNAVKPKSGG
jgi:catechol 2,3-dioxygenase-like lactoylglutathione lyase family enzyme